MCGFDLTVGVGYMVVGMEDFVRKIQPVLEKAGLVSAFGAQPVFTLLHGDASLRRYVRIETEGGRGSWVAMILSDVNARFSSESSKQTGPQASDNELPFVNIHRYLKKLSIRVPEILLIDVQAGIIILEDCGDLTLEKAFLQADAKPRFDMYRNAVDLLVEMQAKTHQKPDSSCLAFSRPYAFDLMRWELDHFTENCLTDTKESLTSTERELINKYFDDLAHTIGSFPNCLVHRDFQSRNIMCKNDELVLIDFQDALWGPVGYDLVALLRDSYTVLETQQVSLLIEHYLEGCLKQGIERPEPDEFHDQFHRITLLRKLKDAGRFVFFYRSRGDSSYLHYVPTSLRYVCEAFDQLQDLDPCHKILTRILTELSNRPSGWEIT